MSLTLIRNDNWNKNENINKPLGRVGHSLHFYYELNFFELNDEKNNEESDYVHDNFNELKKNKENEIEKTSEDNEEKKFENNSFNRNRTNEDILGYNKNNLKNYRNKYIQGKYKVIIFGGGSIEDDFIKNYTNEYLMNRGCIYDEKEQNYITCKSMSIENYLYKTYNDIYICEHKNDFNNWEHIHTYNVPSPRAFHASCVVNLGLNGVFLFVHGGKIKNDLLANDSLYALNLNHISVDEKIDEQTNKRKHINSNCGTSSDDNNYNEEEEEEEEEENDDDEKYENEDENEYLTEINNDCTKEERNIINETNKKCYNSEYDKDYNYNNLKEENKISNLYKKVIKKDFKNSKNKEIKKDYNNVREDIMKEYSESSIQKSGSNLIEDGTKSAELNYKNYGSVEMPKKGFPNSTSEKNEEEMKKHNISSDNFVNNKKVRYSSLSDSSSYLCSNSSNSSSSYSSSSSHPSCISHSSLLYSKDISNNYNNPFENSRNPLKSALGESSSSSGIYDVSNKSISEKIRRKWIQIKIIGNRPNSRYGHTLDFLYPNIILFGGNDKICDVENRYCKNDLWVLNIEKCKKRKKKKKEFLYFTWEEIEYKSINPLGRYFHSTCIWYDKKKKKNNLILYGGKMKNKTNTSRLFLLQKIGNSWVWSILPVYVDCLNENRAYHSIVNINDYIFIIGGEEYNYKYIEKMPSALYSFETKKFHYIDDFTAKACLKCFVKDDIIYSWGGFTDIPLKENFLPNNFITLDINPHILNSQMKDSLYDEFDENFNFFIKAESDSDDNIYKNMNKEILKLEKKQKNLEKDLSIHIKLNDTLNYRLKYQTVQYQKLMQLINFKQRQNAYLFDLLKKKNIDINNGTSNNNNDGDNSLISNMSNSNYTNNSDYFKLYDHVNDNLMNLTNTDVEIHNNVNAQHNSSNVINEMNLMDMNTYKNMVSVEGIKRYSYTNNPSEKEETSEGYLSSQLLYKENYSKNTYDDKYIEDNYSEPVKNNLMNIQEISKFLEKAQSDHFNETYNINKNNLCANEDIEENSKYLRNHLDYKNCSTDILINNNSNVMNDYSIPLDFCMNKQQNNNNSNLIDNPTNNQSVDFNEKKSVTYNENENVKNERDIKLPEREASNQRVRRKTAEKCLKLIEQDRLNRKLNEK